MTRQFSIANSLFCISSPFDLRVDEKWMRFSGGASVPDFRFDLDFAERLELPEGERLVETPHVCVTDFHGCRIRSYREGAASPVAMNAEEASPNHFKIRTLHIAPWGERLGDYLEAIGLPHCLSLRGKLMFHCAYLLHEGQAILFTARSGVGKSTQAGLWVRHRGGRIINGDRAVLGIENGRLMVYGVPLSGSSPDCENISVPVRAVVALAQGKENVLRPLRPAETVKWLMNGSYLAPEFPEDGERFLELGLKLAGKTRGYHLSCLPEESAVDVLYEALYR